MNIWRNWQYLQNTLFFYTNLEGFIFLDHGKILKFEKSYDILKVVQIDFGQNEVICIDLY